MRLNYVLVLMIGVTVAGLNILSMPAVALAVVESRTVESRPIESRGSASSGHSGHGHSEDNASHLSYNQLEALKQEISELRGLIEEQDHIIKQLKKSQQDYYTDLDKRITQTSQNQKPAKTSNANISVSSTPSIKEKKSSVTITPKPSAAPAAVATSVTSTSSIAEEIEIEPAMDLPSSAPSSSKTSSVTITPSGHTQSTSSEASSAAIKPAVTKTPTEKSAYESAYGLVRNKKYAEAVTAFQHYLTQYPQGERTPSAHYWLGEVYMVQWQMDKNKKDLLDKASQSFLTISTQFPMHHKVPDSLLKLGLIESEKGNIEAARRYLSEAKINHPGTAAARIAEARLQQLK